MAEGDERLRRQSAWLARVTIVVMLLLVALILFSARVGSRSVAAGRIDDADLAVRLAAQWLPGIFYLWGMWAIFRIFDNVARGMLFGPAVGSGLVQLGWAMIGGSVASAVLAPNLLRWGVEAGLIFGGPRPFASVFHFDLAYVMLTPLGAAILLLGRLVSRAADYKARSERLQSELDEFF